MTKRISRIAPLQLGIVLGALYAAVSLIFVPFVILFALFGSKMGGHESALAGGIGLAIASIFIPIVYGALGFVGGVLVAVVYNLIASLTGGIEISLSDVAEG